MYTRRDLESRTPETIRRRLRPKANIGSRITEEVSVLNDKYPSWRIDDIVRREPWLKLKEDRSISKDRRNSFYKKKDRKTSFLSVEFFCLITKSYEDERRIVPVVGYKLLVVLLFLLWSLNLKTYSSDKGNDLVLVTMNSVRGPLTYTKTFYSLYENSSRWLIKVGESFFFL